MSDRRRLVGFVAGLAGLLTGALLIAISFDATEEKSKAPLAPSEAMTSQGRAGPRAATNILAELRGQAERHERAMRLEDVRQVIGDPSAERDARRSELRHYAGEGDAAASVARRFFAAFAPYEVGRASPRDERELRSTTTPPFSRELPATEPRLPSGADQPPRARLRGLELALGRRAGGELASLELLAAVERDRERSPLAISMKRGRSGRWLVDGLGR